jgi:hypothetical protein
VSTEEALGKYSKLIGDRGRLTARMTRELRDRNSTTGHSLDMYLATIPADEIRKEAARLRMLQVEKGVDINNLSLSARPFENNANIAALIIQRDNELTAQEAMASAYLENPALSFADRLSARLGREVNARNEIVEREVDKERLKKMARKTTAAIAGGAVGWLIGGKLFNQDVTPPTPPAAPHMPVGPGPVMPPPPSFHTVIPGDNTWNIIEAKAKTLNSTFGGLSEGVQTHGIDSMKDKLAALSPAQLKVLGFSSGDINILKPGDMIDISGVTNTGSVLNSISDAQRLSPSQLTSIVENNGKIAGWLAAHRGELTGPLNSSVIDDILAGRR